MLLRVASDELRSPGADVGGALVPVAAEELERLLESVVLGVGPGARGGSGAPLLLNGALLRGGGAVVGVGLRRRRAGRGEHEIDLVD